MPSWRWLVCRLLLLSLLCAKPVVLSAQEAQEPCDGPYKGKGLSPAELAEVRVLHDRWREKKPDGQRANLCEANLPGAKLPGANLSEAKLPGANLSGANLSEAKLHKAILIGAELSGANLSGAELQEADLERAKLPGANLSGANLSEAKLHKANLSGAKLPGAKLPGAKLPGAKLPGAKLQEADLQRANLEGANLEGANLEGANLEGASLQEARLTNVTLIGTEYAPSSIPHKAFLGGMKELSSVWFRPGQQAGLVLLRGALKEVGLRSLEREATYALKHTERCYNWPVFCHPRFQQESLKAPTGFFTTLEGLFNFLFFERTCAYGLKPGRALLILFGLMPVFAFWYGLALWTATRRAGIWVAYSPEQTYQRRDAHREWHARVIQGIWSPSSSGRQNKRPATKREWRALVTHRRQEKTRATRWVRTCRIALYFSLLSAFHLGWRELNVGTWMTRVQQRPYTLSATGWVRSVSGFQSLLSVYLLALWVLTYFGRPFE